MNSNPLKLLALLIGTVFVLIIIIYFVFIAPFYKLYKSPGAEETKTVPSQTSTQEQTKPAGESAPFNFYEPTYQIPATSTFFLASTTSTTVPQPELTKEEALKLKDFPLQKFYGSLNSKDTKILMNQVFLYQKGRLNLKDITGIYDQTTFEAVKKFQEYLNLAPTAKFDEATVLIGSAFYNALPASGNFIDERPILSFNKEDSPNFYFFGTGLVPLKLNTNFLGLSFFITKIINEKLFNAAGGQYLNKGLFVTILNNTVEKQSCSFYDLDKNNKLITAFGLLPNSLYFIQIKNEAGAIYQKENSLLVCGKKQIEIRLSF